MKPSFPVVVTFMVVWANFSGSTFQSLFFCWSTPACSSTLWSTFARPSKYTSPLSINYFVVLALTAPAVAESASRGTRCWSTSGSSLAWASPGTLRSSILPSLLLSPILVGWSSQTPWTCARWLENIQLLLSPDLILSGSLGLHHLCLQEECLNGGEGQVKQPLQHHRQANVQ